MAMLSMLFDGSWCCKAAVRRRSQGLIWLIDQFGFLNIVQQQNAPPQEEAPANLPPPNNLEPGKEAHQAAA